MFLIIHPAAWFNDSLVYAPEQELFFEKRPADFSWAMQFAGPVIVQNVGKESRVSVEEVFLLLLVVLRREDVFFCYPVKPGVRDGVKRTDVGLMPTSPHVDDNSLTPVRR